MTGVVFYEERLLCFLLFLADPTTRMVYTTSTAIDPAIIEYYLRFVPIRPAPGAGFSWSTPATRTSAGSTAKLLSDPEVFTRLSEAIGDPARAYLLPFIATPVEHELAEALGVPVDGPRSELRTLGSKTGARKAARQAGVGVLSGSEDLFTVEESPPQSRRWWAGDPASRRWSSS